MSTYRHQLTREVYGGTNLPLLPCRASKPASQSQRKDTAWLDDMARYVFLPTAVATIGYICSDRRKPVQAFTVNKKVTRHDSNKACLLTELQTSYPSQYLLIHQTLLISLYNQLNLKLSSNEKKTQ